MTHERHCIRLGWPGVESCDVCDAIRAAVAEAVAATRAKPSLPEELADEARAIFLREFPGLDWETEMKKYLKLLTQAHVAAAVAEERERCAKIAAKSSFVDGPLGTIEGQIAAAIRGKA